MSAEFGRQPGGKPRGPEVELRSATRHQFTFTLHPRTVDCKGRLSRCDKCATEAISSRSAVLLTVNRSEFVRAVGVYRLRAGTSAKMQSGPSEVKVLMGFEQDAAGVAEAQSARPGIVPVLLSEAEVEQHELTHLPFRSWCRHCVRAKGKESPHHESSPGGVSTFANRHFSWLRWIDEGVLCSRCTLQTHESWLRRKSTCASHQKVMLQSDQEPSNIDVKHKAGTHIPTEIVYEESPVGDSNANGSIERANQTIQGQIGAIKDYTERQIGATIGLDSSILKWLARHAAWTLTTFHVRRYDSSSMHQKETIHQSTDRSVR